MQAAGRLAGKVAIVTGSGAGFGAGIARRFAEEGCKVVIADIAEADGRRVATEIRDAGGDASFFKADVSQDEATGRLVSAAFERYGDLDIMVNNAGVPQVNGPMHEVGERDFDRIFAVNVKSLFWAARHTVPHFRAKGGGVIINTSSTAAVRPRAGLVWYNGSKGAVDAITRSMAIELAPHKVRVNAVSPVAGDTQMLEQFLGGPATPAERRRFEAAIPLGRLSRPLDIANAALFLVSDEASMITGVCLPVDGGRLI
jgi:3-oxoacyl-[acyl-carrier protein] reductase